MVRLGMVEDNCSQYLEEATFLKLKTVGKGSNGRKLPLLASGDYVRKDYAGEESMSV